MRNSYRLSLRDKRVHRRSILLIIKAYVSVIDLNCLANVIVNVYIYNSPAYARSLC